MDYSKATILELENSIMNLQQMLNGCKKTKMKPEYEKMLRQAEQALAVAKAKVVKKIN